ncbi:MAG: exodeoxyribonuclease III [Flavobacteriaceae bacterium]|tara:strand:+ start:81 stop:842 length:762 start_codon:yes stop_codon:yes gene_type:complete
MKIISYNINGIRAALKKNLINWIQSESPDIICFQEIKANKDQFDFEIFNSLGYYNFWFSAQKKGYSGVAILSKIEPKKIKYGTGINHIDFEGRVIRADFEKFSVISLYLPSGTNNLRLNYKLKFMDDFLDYINKLKQEFPNLIICGDYNICHKHIDIHDPIRNKNVSGFLIEERMWLDKFLELGFTDSFRLLNKNPNEYSWWSYRANSRQNNKGWRIDYNLVSNSIKENIYKSYILSDVCHSDHCPVGVELNF